MNHLIRFPQLLLEDAVKFCEEHQITFSEWEYDEEFSMAQWEVPSVGDRRELGRYLRTIPLVYCLDADDDDINEVEI